MKKATLIVPCGGLSSRYPNLRPKYLLTNPNGNLMLFDVISKLNLKGCDFIVSVLREHEEKYKIRYMFRKFFGSYKIRLHILEKPTKDVSEAMCQILQDMKVTGPFLIKDNDNIFRLERVYEKYNYIATLKLKDVGITNAANKSYVVLDKSGFIGRIEEKKVISDTFNVGGYYFTNPIDFIQAFERIRKDYLDKEIYISHIIKYLISEGGVKFKSKNVTEYLDLGTVKEWIAYKEKQKVYFIDIDGVILENSGEYFPPYWNNTKGIEGNVKSIQSLYNDGAQIILTTSRRKKNRTKTIEQLKKYKVPFHQLVMDIYHSQRVLINDFANSNPYPSAVGVSIPRDSDKLGEYLAKRIK